MSTRCAIYLSRLFADDALRPLVAVTPTGNAASAARVAAAALVVNSTSGIVGAASDINVAIEDSRNTFSTMAMASSSWRCNGQSWVP